MAGSKAKSTSSQKKTKRKPGSAPIQTKAKPKNQPGPKGGSKQRGNKLNNAAASQDAVGNQASSRTGKNDESKKKKPESQLVKDLKAIMRDVARPLLEDESLSETANLRLAAIMKASTKQALRDIAALEEDVQQQQQQNDVVGHQEEQDSELQELLEMDDASLKKCIKDLKAQEAEASARLQSYRHARHEVERRERDEYHKLHPLVRDLHPEMSQAIVDVSDQPVWLRQAVREYDAHLHDREERQQQSQSALHLTLYNPAQDEWLQAFMASLTPARRCLHSMSNLRELDSLIETGLRVV